MSTVMPSTATHCHCCFGGQLVDELLDWIRADVFGLSRRRGKPCELKCMITAFSLSVRP